MKRDQAWLAQLLDDTWDRYFGDVPQDNIVRIEFGRKARTRLGSIRVDAKDRGVSIITLNGLFRSEEIPEMVVRATLVHELCHYAHGFNSPVLQNKRYPHAGGVMKREFTERGLLELYLTQRRWLKTNWPGVVEKHFAANSRRVTVVPSAKVPRPFWFGR